VVLLSKMLALTLARRTTSKRSLSVLLSASHKTPTYISQSQPQTRSYAKRRQALDEDADTDFVYHKGKKGKQGKDMKHADEVILDKNNITDPSLRFVPSSSMPHGAAYDAEEKSADEKMAASVRWLKETARGVEVRSSGRVVPDVLDAVRVRIRLDEEGEGEEGEMEVGLKEVASVGVKNGNVLVVTVFEEQVSLLLGLFFYTLRLTALFVDDQSSRKGALRCETSWPDTPTIGRADNLDARIPAHCRVAKCTSSGVAKAGRGDESRHS
jgi:ribosome recycling factor